MDTVEDRLKKLEVDLAAVAVLAAACAAHAFGDNLEAILGLVVNNSPKMTPDVKATVLKMGASIQGKEAA
ncbi:hypothetical protein DAI43_17090 [Achromobacter xylosoxidans]|uniref:hypothetical protein n=1 Tax=Achromobacter aegrifaciens TaxID=1287736 RepID=UPI000D4CFC9B|nr:hypothetical protein [Achromobacter aegrifaciens]MDQ1758998.1 hypothetical protein [Achromobacter aegrifaciens]PTN50410.1 hypothetical protein DAI43_17090 [Achromobacter xylosoxidans]